MQSTVLLRNWNLILCCSISSVRPLWADAAAKMPFAVPERACPASAEAFNPAAAGGLMADTAAGTGHSSSNKDGGGTDNAIVTQLQWRKSSGQCKEI